MYFTTTRRPPMSGFGDYNDETQCTAIPVGDPYRKPGNYCATADGGYTTFNADGTVYTVPADSSSGSWWDSVTKALSSATAPTPVVPGVPILPATGISTTMVAVAGGAVLLAVLLATR